jgi:carbon monoxide dehydrogenase subunit G
MSIDNHLIRRERKIIMKVSVRDTIEAPAGQVWQRVSSFDSIHTWFPPATDTTVRGEGLGAVRTLHMNDGSEINEQLESIDDDTYTLTYTIVDEETPFQDYLSTIRVESVGDSAAKLTWSATLDPAIPEDEARGTLEQLYASGIQELRRQLES